jgi:DNA polymerase-1
MIQAYQEGKDFHDAVAADMFGAGFDKEQRNMAKTINFGVAFGRGPSSIAEVFHKTMNEARAIIALWFASKPGAKEYIKNRRDMVLRG